MFFLLLCFACNVPAQVIFQKTFGGLPGDYGYSVKQTTDGNYIIAGATSSFGGGFRNGYLIKTNSYGDTLWTSTFGGGQNDYFNSVEQTTDGGYIMAGTTESFVAINDVYLVKTDSLGHLQWSMTYGGNSNEDGRSVKQTADGGYIIAGYTTTYGSGLADIYLIKTDSIGDTLWTRTYGGTNDDQATSVIEVIGGYLITGHERSYSAGSYDAFLLKTDSAGNPMWMKAYGTAESENGFFIEATDDGGYVLTGYTKKNNNQDVLLIKTDSLGDTLWTRSYGGTSPDVGYCVKQTNDGGYIITGSTSASGIESDCFIIKLNSTGDTLWTKIIGGQNTDIAYSVQETNDYGYIISGYTGSFGVVTYDVYLIKTDSLGNAGCSEKSYTTVVGSPAIIITNAMPQVSSGGIVSTPNTFEYFGANVSTVCSNVGVNEIVVPRAGISVYPNPASSDITLSYSILYPGTSALTVFDVTGRQVANFTLNNSAHQTKLNIGLLENGFYTFNVTTDDKTIAKGKFSVVR